MSPLAMGSFKMVDDSPPEEPPTPSKALIASDGDGNGVLLEWTGSAISWHVAEFSRALDELGLSDAPEGLSVWEGKMGSVRIPDSPNSMGEWDFEATGTFRNLTPEEAGALANGGSLWPGEPEPEVKP